MAPAPRLVRHPVIDFPEPAGAEKRAASSPGKKCRIFRGSFAENGGHHAMLRAIQRPMACGRWVVHGIGRLCARGVLVRRLGYHIVTVAAFSSGRTQRAPGLGYDRCIRQWLPGLSRKGPCASELSSAISNLSRYAICHVPCMCGLTLIAGSTVAAPHVILCSNLLQHAHAGYASAKYGACAAQRRHLPW